MVNVMENSVENISSIQPASFARRWDKISDGQDKILRLLQKRIEENKPITTEDIVDCYFATTSKDGLTVRVRGNFSYDSFFCHDVPKTNGTARNRAIIWFKQNLGSCIIKGRLLAIPIIEIDEPKTIEL
jgi:hypothetical protein